MKRIEMETVGRSPFEGPVPGVKPAEQKRSRILQDKFSVAGRTALLDTRLRDLSIPQLAKAAKSSVGGFYSRFETKEAFFEFLRMQMLTEHLRLYENRLTAACFEGRDHRAVSEEVVDVMIEVFSGPWRGVLREAYSVIPERPESWAPMRERGVMLRAMILPLYAARVEAVDGLEERLSMAVQLLFSALNNEMMNANLPFGIEDPRFRDYLVFSLDALVAGEAKPLAEKPR